MGIFSIFKSKKQRKLDEIARVSSVFKNSLRASKRRIDIMGRRKKTIVYRAAFSYINDEQRM